MKAKRNENPLLSLIFSIALPSLVLTKLSGDDKLGPVGGLLVALAFPIFYSLFDFAKRRDLSFISVLGFVSTLLTGVFALYQLPADWIAVKEASIPLLIGTSILLSMRTSQPLVKKILYNENLINVALIEERLVDGDKRTHLDRMLKEASYLLASSFLLSAILNFLLAKLILVSEPGTTAFNTELGKMNTMSWPIIALPSTAILLFALWRLLRGIESLTGLDIQNVMKQQDKSE